MNELIEKSVAIVREGTLPVMLPLILCSAAIWLLIIERSFYLFDTPLLFWWPPLRRRIRQLKSDIAHRLDAYLDAPTTGNRRHLLLACQSRVTPYSSFLLSALSGAKLSRKTIDLQISEAALTSDIRIERGLQVLSTLAKVAPLLGLLGTVIGMIQTFQAMMFASTSDPRALSSGISIALIATEVGLVVSLPGVIGMSSLSRRAQILEEEIHVASMRLRSALLGSKEAAAPETASRKPASTGEAQA